MKSYGILLIMALDIDSSHLQKIQRKKILFTFKNTFKLNTNQL